MADEDDKTPVNPTLRGSIGEAKRLHKADRLRREAATNILDANTLHDEDTSQQLYTLLHGEKRVITIDDMKAFKNKVDAFRRDVEKRRGKGSVGGITARSIISHSLAVDVQRAKSQIRRAALHNLRASDNGGGVLHFVTNAGPDSAVTRHHVHIQMLGWGAAVASPQDPKKAARELQKGLIRFDCDCGRHTFWLRYLATIGGWNYGRSEQGFPKIRNPHLTGVACKHVLRVATEFESSPFVTATLERLIIAARKEGASNKAAIDIRQAEADAAHPKRAREIKTDDRRKEEARKARERRAAKKAATAAPEPKDVPPVPKHVAAAMRIISAMREAGESEPAIRTTLADAGMPADVIKQAMKGKG